MPKRRKIQSDRPRPSTDQPPLRPLTRFVDVHIFAAWAAIFLAVPLAYWPALHGGLVWDDTAHVTAPSMQSLHGLWRIWFDLGATQQYYPLLYSAFWIEHRLWGDAVLGYHLANVALHALAACLVVLIVRRLALPGAWLAGLIFALHPVCVEAVAWISEQKSTLSAVFYLAAGLTYLHFDQSRRRSRYLWALGLFVLALLSKTVTAILPAALLVVFWWQRGRLDWRRDVHPLLPWFVLGAGAGLFTAWVEKTRVGAEGAGFSLSLAQRLLLPGRMIFFYAGKLLWPSNLIFTYPRWQPDVTVWWQYLYPLGVVILVVVLWSLPRRGPLAGFLIFSGTLFPVLGFLNVYPFRYSFVADHFQYLASLGIIVPVACGLVLGISRISPGKTANTAVLLMVPAVLAILTWRESGMYSDSQTLYRTTLARNPNSWMAHDNLGIILAQVPGRLPGAIAEFQAAVRLNPANSHGHVNLGNALEQVPGRLPQAIAEYQAALRIEPDYAEAHSNLGFALAQIPGQLPQAIAEYRAALRIRPSLADTHDYLGVALAQTPSQLPAAIAEYQAALRFNPKYAEAHYNLGSALAQMGRLPEAIAEFQAALRIQSGDAEAHNNLGVVLAQTGRLPEAIAEFQAALRIQPDYAEAQNNLRSALSKMPGEVRPR
ncbi:MAG: tetratricopeptide repeat protein [Terriglobales bacterium]